MPWLRWNSALLIRISTLPPIEPARSSTERASVSSSGTTVTLARVSRCASKPGGCFHGSAIPAHTMSAPASTRALHQCLPGRALAVGDQNFPQFRIGGHLTQHPVVGQCWACRSREVRSARPVRPCRDARARGRRVRIRGRAIAVQMRQHRDAFAQAHEAEPQRHALAVIELVGVMQQRCRRSVRPRRQTGCHSRRTDRQFVQASRGGYCTARNRGRSAIRTAFGDRCGHDAARRGCAPTAAASAAAAAGSDCAFLAGRLSGVGHCALMPAARIAAPVQRPRS